jgi:chemotaxis protein MotB
MTTETESSDHGGGENYFVSMTDMMVGMLFIFIIMLMTFALLFQQRTDEQQDKIVVAEDVAKKLQELQEEVDLRLEEIREATELRRQVIEEIKAALEASGIIVTSTHDVLRFNDNAIRFESSSAELRPDAQLKVQTIAEILSERLPKYLPCPDGAEPPQCRSATQSSVETVFVEGHTDSTGLDDKNWTLSTERAANTYQFLTAGTAQLRKLMNRNRREILSISGYSDTRPIVEERTSEDRALNRRIDLRFVMDTDPTAGLTEIGRKLAEMDALVQCLLDNRSDCVPVER